MGRCDLLKDSIGNVEECLKPEIVLDVKEEDHEEHAEDNGEGLSLAVLIVSFLESIQDGKDAHHSEKEERVGFDEACMAEVQPEHDHKYLDLIQMITLEHLHNSHHHQQSRHKKRRQHVLRRHKAYSEPHKE